MSWGPWSSVSEGRAAPGSSVTAVAIGGDRFALFVGDPNGGVYTTSGNTEHGWSPWSGVSEGRVAPGSSVTAVAIGGDRFALFVGDPNGGVYTTSGNTEHDWGPWSGVSEGRVAPGSSVTAVAIGGDRFALFVGDPKGGVYTTSGNAEHGWGPWSGVSEGRAALGSSVTAVAIGGDRFALFVGDPSGGVYTTSGNAEHGWSPWSGVSEGRAAPGSSVTAVAIGGDRFALFVGDPNGGVYTTSGNTEHGWGPWSGVSEGRAAPGSSVTAVAIGGDRFALFVGDPNGGVYTTSGNTEHGWGPWSGVSEGRAAPGSPVTAVAIGGGSFALFVADPNGGVYTTSWDSNFRDVVVGMNPVAYWRLGEPSGSTVVRDISTYAIDGTYHGVSLSIPGAIVGDRDTAASFDGRSAYAEVPDHKIYSLTRAWDNFNRVSSGYSNTWGVAAGQGTWEAQVSHGVYYATNGKAVIDPHGARGTFQQGLPSTTLLGGDMQVRASWSQHATNGPLQPLALVAQRVDNNNFIRAELLENPDHTLTINLIKTVNGSNTSLATASNVGTYGLGDWWYLRFQFDGPVLKARAWKMGTPQPNTWQVCAVASSANVGGIAIRSANSASSARPIVWFEGFWTQTLGLSIHLFVKVSTSAQLQSVVHLFGKGDHTEGFLQDGNREYYFRYHDHSGHLKAYVYSREGGYGAGVDVPNIIRGRWYQLIMMLDSGDALDLQAGITLYVDGQRAGGAPEAGAKYDGGIGCKPPDICWQIYPLSGDAPLRFGTVAKDTYFKGSLDDVAIFSRKLTPAEVLTLFNSS